MRLRVITYNIHRAIGVDRRFRPERIVAILAHYDADLVFLQEVDEGAPRSRELDLAKELAGALGYPHFAVGHNVTLRKGRYGNATLSRFPIVREANLDLTIDSSPIGSLIRRGCQHTTLALPGERALEAFNLHLGLSARERERQVGLLVNAAEFRRVGAEIPLLVGGDFNDWRSLLRPIF
ncbi:MAG TPA: endonuclease/exonuclease/phosphatase family protein, partial [Thermoanaerobaculia bacterium]|nr:endonuclease/exonuclease/phosphatase family protein [Thermoanaerobaculia bacterium]